METYEQKYERLKRSSEDSHKRINKLLCERDPLRNERFNDRKAKLQYYIVMLQHRIDRLNQEAKPLLEKKAGYEADLKKIIADHENFEDHQLYTDIPLSAINLNPQQEIAELEKQLTHYAQMSVGIKERIAKVKASLNDDKAIT